MDPITHCLVGALLAKSARAPRRRFWLMTLLGDLPDVDVLFAGLGPWAFWLQHRGITHSLLGVVIQAFLCGWLFARFDKGPLIERVTQYSLPLFFHLGCDYLTSYGIPLLSPFSFREFSGDLVPAVTVIPLAFMVIGLLYLHRKDRDGWSAVRPLWAAWAFYLLISMSSKTYAARLAEPVEGPMTVVAGLVNPLKWIAVVQKGSAYTYQPYAIDVLQGKKTIGALISTSSDGSAIRASLNSAEVKRFIETVRWPVARERIRIDGVDVEWGKMIFSSRGTVRGILNVHVAKDGTVTNVDHVFDFWNPAHS